MNCQKCGSPLNVGDLFCTTCGQKVETNQPTVAPPTDVAQPVMASNPVTPNSGQPTAAVPADVAQTLTAPSPAPLNNAQPQVTQAPIAPVVGGSKKKLFIIGGVVGGVLLLIAVVLTVYLNMPPVKFNRLSEPLEGSNYSLRMLKGWDTEVVSGFIGVFNGSDDSEGIILKGKTNYDNSKKQVDTALDNLEDKLGAKFEGKEITAGKNKYYVAEASGKFDGDEMLFYSFLMYDDKSGESSWIMMGASTEEVKSQISKYSKYILASVEYSDDSTARSMGSGSGTFGDLGSVNFSE